LPVFKVKTRLQSGVLEIALGKHVPDKTNWRKMLKGEVQPIDLKQQRDELLALCEEDIKSFEQEFGADAYELLDESIVDIHYPVKEFPVKVSSFNFDKQAEVSGVLNGIKGQYLIFDTGVINIRKFTSYEVEVRVS